jgi:hypothetical protein
VDDRIQSVKAGTAQMHGWQQSAGGCLAPAVGVSTSRLAHFVAPTHRNSIAALPLLLPGTSFRREAQRGAHTSPAPRALKYRAIGMARYPARSYTRRPGAWPGSPPVPIIATRMPASHSQTVAWSVSTRPSPWRWPSGSTASMAILPIDDETGGPSRPPPPPSRGSTGLRAFRSRTALGTPASPPRAGGSPARRPRRPPSTRTPVSMRAVIARPLRPGPPRRSHGYVPPRPEHDGSRRTPRDIPAVPLRATAAKADAIAAIRYRAVELDESRQEGTCCAIRGSARRRQALRRRSGLDAFFDKVGISRPVERKNPAPNPGVVHDRIGRDAVDVADPGCVVHDRDRGQAVRELGVRERLWAVAVAWTAAQLHCRDCCHSASVQPHCRVGRIPAVTGRRGRYRNARVPLAPRY